MAPPGDHQGHGQFRIDTYELEVSNKTQVSDQGSLGPLLLCVNTWFAFKVHDKCCFHLKCLLYVRLFLIWQYPDIQVIAIHAFPKIYLDIKMSDFEANSKKNFGGFYKYTQQDVCKLKNTA